MDEEFRDVTIVGAGIAGIYQLYTLLSAGFTARLLEAGGGVGGTWYWNRYPQARFDSESYSYGYLFSRELYEDWHWTEHFAGQPETEAYLNHVVDRYGLRDHIVLDARVTSAVYSDDGTWAVQTEAGVTARSRWLIAATGSLSVPFVPDVEGRADFRGEQFHTGSWPTEPVDFAGKRVAVVGTGSSGVQIVPAIVGEVAELTVFQRTANWCTPLNNGPISPSEQAQLAQSYDCLVDLLDQTFGGFVHRPSRRRTFEDSREERWAFYEHLWNSRGFAKLASNYDDLALDPAANAEWCDFIAGKIRSIVHDPETARALIPTDHGYAMKRPPMVTGYYEVFNRPNVSLVDLREDPIVCVTPSGIQTARRDFDEDIIVWATGFDAGTGALMRMGARGRGGVRLEDAWSDGPRTFLGLQTPGFPNLFHPGGPHGSSHNRPRGICFQVETITQLLSYMRERDLHIVEPTPQAEEAWTELVYAVAEKIPTAESSWFIGANVPGKARRFLIYADGLPAYRSNVDQVVASGYSGLVLSPAETG